MAVLAEWSRRLHRHGSASEVASRLVEPQSERDREVLRQELAEAAKENSRFSRAPTPQYLGIVRRYSLFSSGDRDSKRHPDPTETLFGPIPDQRDEEGTPDQQS